MSLSQPKKQDSKKAVGPDDSFYEHPEVVLLDEQHWSYLQRRYHMSPREVQVADLVCRGFTNGQIAGKLKIKNGTAKTHLRNIYRKVRVKNKITMLLKLVDGANKLSSRKGITPPIPIVEIKEPAKKPRTEAEVRKKDK